MYKPKAQIVWYASSNRCAEKNKADEKNGEIGEKSGFWLDLGHFSRLHTKIKTKSGVRWLKICTNQRRKLCDMPRRLDLLEKNNADEKMVEKVWKSHDFDSILDIFQDCKPKTGSNQAYDGLKFVQTKGANCVICLID